MDPKLIVVSYPYGAVSAASESRHTIRAISLAVALLCGGLGMTACSSSTEPTGSTGMTSLIAFARHVNGRFEIYTMNVDGSDLRRLTHNESTDDTQPAWSPKADRIAFTGGGPSNSGVYVMDIDGASQTRLTTTRKGWDPAWSGDGRKIVFAGPNAQGIASDIWVMNAEGSGQTRLTSDRNFWGPTWSPNSQRIAFQSPLDIWVMNADGTGRIQLTNDLAAFAPAWSPDGSRIAFTRVLDFDPQDVLAGNLEIFVMNANGSNLINLTNDPAVDALPTWSPDGSKIAFLRVIDAKTNPFEGNYEIFVMNADGSGQTNLTKDPSMDSDPAWSPALVAR